MAPVLLKPAAPSPQIVTSGSGGTSTGKTTFLNALMREVPVEERVIVVEDTAEVQLHGPNDLGLIAVKGEKQADQILTLSAAGFTRFFQITDGELRFPALGNITWAGGSSFVPGDPAPAPNNLGYSCLLSPDSARVHIQNEQGLAYHVVLNVETETGVTQIPLLQNPVGRLWSDALNCPPSYASGCDGWGVFHMAVRDSAGIKLLPAFVSVRWENYAGMADSLLPPYGWPYAFGEYGVSACSR